MMLLFVPQVFAANSGTIGDNAIWSLDGNMLTISGSGALENYPTDLPGENDNNVMKQKFTSVVISEGITSVGTLWFSFCPNITSLYLPVSLTKIEEAAFTDCYNLTDIYYAGTQEMWNAISIERGNLDISYAEIHFAGNQTSHTKQFDEYAANMYVKTIHIFRSI